MATTGTTIALKGRKVRKDPVAYSETSIRNNAAILDYCRTSMSALSGSTAGILGLTGLYGFAFYFITAFILSVMLLLKAGHDWHKFVRSRNMFFTAGLFGGLFTYILFWTNMAAFVLLKISFELSTLRQNYEFLYGMVHVY